MVKILAGLLTALLSSPVVLELVGAVLIVVALGLLWGAPAVLAGAGVAVILKSAELEAKQRGRK